MFSCSYLSEQSGNQPFHHILVRTAMESVAIMMELQSMGVCWTTTGFQFHPGTAGVDVVSTSYFFLVGFEAPFSSVGWYWGQRSHLFQWRSLIYHQSPWSPSCTHHQLFLLPIPWSFCQNKLECLVSGIYLVPWSSKPSLLWCGAPFTAGQLQRTYWPMTSMTVYLQK